MINANELRIGNLVTIKNIDYHPILKGIPALVKGVKERKDSSFPNSEFVVDLFVCEEYKHTNISQFNEFIKPIPLTEEILLKCGFENVGIDKRKFCDVYLLNSVRLTVSNGGHIYYGKIWVESLHQLQNLYFALTGEELKIEI